MRGPEPAELLKAFVGKRREELLPPARRPGRPLTSQPGLRFVWELWLLALLVILLGAVAFLYSNLGLGGGQLYVPIMIWVLSPFPIHEAIPLSLAMAWATSVAATYTHHQRAFVDFRIGTLLGGVGVLGTLGGVMFTLSQSDELIQTLFGTMLLLVATKMLWDLAHHTEDLPPGPPPDRRRLGVAVLVALGIGLLVGTLGIAGGVVSVPLIIYLLGYETRRAIGTSAYMGALLTPAAFFAYALSEPTLLHEDLLVLLTPIVALSAYLGSHWGLARLRVSLVRTIFIAGVIVAATSLFVKLL